MLMNQNIISNNKTYKFLLDKCIEVLSNLFEIYIINPNDFYLIENKSLLSNDLFQEIHSILINECETNQEFNYLSTINHHKTSSKFYNLPIVNDYFSIINSNLIEIFNDSQEIINEIQSSGDKKTYEVSKIYSLLSVLIPNFFLDEKNFLLELGCGKSYFYKYLLNSNQSVIKYIGVDKKEELIEKTIQNNKKGNSHVSGCVYNENMSVRVYNDYITYENFHDFYNKFSKDFDYNLNSGILFGLHSCGDLTSNAIKIFINEGKEYEKFKYCIMIGCCFNLLSEYISKDVSESSPFIKYKNSLGYGINKENLDTTLKFNYKYEEIGYPMSKYMKQQKTFFLGRTIRNASMQSNEYFSEKSDEYSLKLLYYRSLFQKFLEKHVVKLKNTYGYGKLKRYKKRINTMKEYFQVMIENMTKLKEKIQINDSDLLLLSNSYEMYYNDFEIEYENKENYIKFMIFYFIRVYFAKIIEIIVNLDRIMFLEEASNIKTIRLFKVFNEKYSIRNYLIYSEKY